MNAVIQASAEAMQAMNAATQASAEARLAMNAVIQASAEARQAMNTATQAMVVVKQAMIEPRMPAAGRQRHVQVQMVFTAMHRQLFVPGTGMNTCG